MKVLLIGGNGSIGRRYRAVLKALKVDYRIHEINDMFSTEDCTHIIVASPTETHLHMAMLSAPSNLPILIEKPLSKSLKECELLMNYFDAMENVSVFVVNNYSFALLPINNYTFCLHAQGTISYDFFNTGKDGLLWDVCQLIYFAKLWEQELFIRTESYFWDLQHRGCSLHYRRIEESYFQMLQAFLANDREKLWSLRDGIRMTQAVLELEKLIGVEDAKDLKGFDWSPSQKRFKAFTGKDIRGGRTEIYS